MKNIRKKLIKTFEKRRFARIKRKVSKYRTYINRGYITSISKELIFFRETENFELLGLIALPINQLLSIRYNKNDRYYDFIMESEGEKKSIKEDNLQKCHNFKLLFKYLKDRDEYVIVELEREGVFIIGEIIEVKKNSVHIRYFDATGIFENDVRKIRYKKITKVIFNDRYIDVFRKYLQ